MANPAARLRALVQAQHPGAIVTGRGRNWLRHTAPSGRVILDASIGPLHYGAAQEINSDWEPDTGAWQWRMVQADFQAHARSVFNAGNLIEYRDTATDQWVIFDPQSINWINEQNSRQQIAVKQAVAARVSGDVMSFPAAYGAGRHFSYELQPSRLKKLLTLDSAAALPAPTVAGTVWLEMEFSLSTSSGVDLYLDGARWAKQNNVRVRTASRVEFRDAATGQTVLWVLDFPRAWDSAEEPSQAVGQIEVRRQGGASNLFITVRIPKTWLDAALYPVYIDPTIDTAVGASSDDATQDVGSNMDLTSSPCLTIDRTDEYLGVRFTGVTIPDGATIDVAYLTVRPSTSGNDEPLHTIWAHDDGAPGTFTSTAADISNRTATTATVLWDAADLGADGTNDFNTPSLVSIIQELMGSYSYAAGSSMAFILQGSATATRDLAIVTYDGDTTNCARLHIEYTAGGGTVNDETGEARAPGAASGADQAVWAEQGLGTSPVAASGADQSVFAEAGAASSPGSASGADQSVFAEAGAASSPGSASGADQSVWVETASGQAPGSASGADQSVFAEAGAASSPAGADGADQAVWVENGGGTATFGGSGTASIVGAGNVYSVSGGAASGGRASGADQAVWGEAGAGTASIGGTGADQATFGEAGAAAATAAGTGADQALWSESGGAESPASAGGSGTTAEPAAGGSAGSWVPFWPEWGLSNEMVVTRGEPPGLPEQERRRRERERAEAEASLAAEMQAREEEALIQMLLIQP